MSGCFDCIKENLTAVPVLAYPDTSKPYILYTDASDDCIRACICQEQDTQGEMIQMSQMKNLFTVCHISLQLVRQTVLQLKERLFLLFYDLQILDQYWNDSEFVIRTDHKPLKYIMDSPVQSKKIQHWITNICGSNCRIEYMEG